MAEFQNLLNLTEQQVIVSLTQINVYLMYLLLKTTQQLKCLELEQEAN